jgi:hypothetical protein
VTRLRVAAAVGLLVVLSGVATFWWTNTHPSVSYAGSYEPSPAYGSTLTLQLDDPPFTVSWDTGHLVGLALLVTGLLVLAGVAGFALGRRSRL